MNVAKSLPAEGNLIGRATSRGPRSQRWTDVAIYRDVAGGYEVADVGRSTLPGEEDRLGLYSCRNAREAVAALAAHTPGALRLVARDALHAAAAADAQFAAELGDAADVEDLPPLGDSVFTVARDRNRVLRFSGELLGAADSNERGRRERRWTEYRIYRAAGGAYVVETIGRADATGEDRHAATIATDGAGIVAGLLRDGGLSSLAYDLLVEVARRDADFAATLALAHERAPRRYSLERDGKPPLRFTGFPLGDAEDRGAGVKAYVNRTAAGDYVLASVRAGRPSATFADAGVVAAVARRTPRDDVQFAAIAAAAKRDPQLAAALEREGIAVTGTTA